MDFTNDMTIGTARAILTDKLLNGAEVQCPTCSQHAKVYRRAITSTMAADLIRMWHAKGDEDGWMHLPTALGHNTGDTAKLAYWGLIEPMPSTRTDGSPRTGWWRLTFDGELFAQGKTLARKYVHVYDGRVQGASGELITIRDALGARFNYDELMQPAPVPGGTMEQTSIAG